MISASNLSWEMSGCNSNQNYYIQNNRSTSRVLHPPGGRSSISLGGGGDSHDTRGGGGAFYDSRDHRAKYREENTDRQASMDSKQTSVVAKEKLPRDREDIGVCSIPGLEHHYKELAGRSGAPMARSSGYKESRDVDSEAMGVMRKEMGHIEGDGRRREEPPFFRRVEKQRHEDRREVEQKQGKPQVRRFEEESRGTGRTSKKSSPKDAYENILSSNNQKSGSAVRSNTGKNVLSQAPAQFAGRDVRGPKVPPGGHSSFSIGWDS